MSRCSVEAQAFVQCRAMDTTGECAACAPVDFNSIQTTFPEGLQQKFMMAMAFASPGSPEFCLSVTDGICADYAANACCCEGEVGAWQSCLVEKDFSVAVGQQNPCSVSCVTESTKGGGGGGGGGGGSTGIVISAVVVVLLIVGGGVGGFLFIRKRRANTKGINDDKDNDTFQDESEGKQKKGGLFSRGKKNKSCDSTESPKGSDIEDHAKPKRTPSKRDSKTPNSKKRGKNSSKRLLDGAQTSQRFVDNDIEDGGPPTELQFSDDEDSITDQYTSCSRKVGNKENRGSTRNVKKSSSARERKQAIENWNKSRRQGGEDRSYQSYIPENEKNFDDDISELESDLEPRRPYRSNTIDLSSKVKATKKISSRELKNLMKEHEDSTRRLDFMEEEIADVEDQLAERDREAEDLRLQREEQQRRIKELESLNARLTEEAFTRSQILIDNSNDFDGHSSYSGGRSGGGYGGRSSRSKASMREEPENYERRNSSRSRPRARSRSNSGRKLGEMSGPRRPQSRSPSSTRSLGKQASTMRRESSREKLERSSSRRNNKTSSNVSSRSMSKARSRSPRSYLRDED